MFISTITFLQHLPLYLYDALVHQKIYSPEALLFNKARFSREFVYRLFKNLKNDQDLKDLPIIKAIESDIDTNVVDQDIRDFMKAHVLFYTLLLFLAETEENIKETLFSKEFPFTFDHNFMIHNCVETQIKVFRDDYRLGTPDQKATVATLVIQLFTCLFSKIIEGFHKASDRLQNNLLPPTCTISEVFQKRLAMLSLFSNDKDIIHFLQSSTVPKNYAIRNTNKSKKLNPYMFKELQLYLPHHVTFTPHSQLAEFEKFIWKTHIHKSPMMRERLPGVRFTSLSMEFTESEILQQIFVFSLENWEEVWRLNFPCSIEVVKRLKFFKQYDNWKPSADELVKTMLLN
jgi:hypothetical protein